MPTHSGDVTRALPNLLLVGFPKCGTTTVAESLNRHSEVSLALPHRATHHYTPLLYRGRPSELPSLSEYAKHYLHGVGSRIRVDDTAVWVYGDQTMVEVIRGELPAAKVLIMLREPASRTSSYLQWKKRNAQIQQNLRLPEYVEECLTLGSGVLHDPKMNPWTGFHGSLYAEPLSIWSSLFGAQLKVGFLEQLAIDPRGFFHSLCAWLELDPPHLPDAESLSKANAARRVRSEHFERFVRAAGQSAQPLARKMPYAYRGLRDLARRLNTQEVSKYQNDEELADLVPAFRGDVEATSRLVRRHTLNDFLPTWLTSVDG